MKFLGVEKESFSAVIPAGHWLEMQPASGNPSKRIAFAGEVWYHETVNSILHSIPYLKGRLVYPGTARRKTVIGNKRFGHCHLL